MVTLALDADPGSLFATLEPLLARVSKPIQYVGGEHNSVLKAWSDVEVRWCLMYPDAYEVGQPNQGVAILYEILNELDWVVAERTYAIWPDLAALLRDRPCPVVVTNRLTPAADVSTRAIGTSTAAIS